MKKCPGHKLITRSSYMADGSKLVKDKDIGRIWVHRKLVGTQTSFCAVAALRTGYKARGITIAVNTAKSGSPTIAGPVNFRDSKTVTIRSAVHLTNGKWTPAKAFLTGALKPGAPAKPSTGSGSGSGDNAAPPKPATDGVIPSLSKLAWPSGVYVPHDNPSGSEAFGAWRGQPIAVALTWPGRDSWGQFTGAVPSYTNFRGKPYFVALGVPPLPNSGANYADCIADEYRSHWTTFGRSIKSAGIENKAIIRLGWEFNGDWYPFSQKEVGFSGPNFAACWRKIHAAVESVAPGVRWDWSVNRGPSQSLGNNVESAYPGDAYVDIIGVDSYDQYPGVKTESDWNTHLNGTYGLNHWVKFARAHGKKLSVPEWGNYPARGANAGGDNPLYIRKMHAFFKANASIMAYEAYFNESQSYYGGAIHGPVQVPKASAEYRKLWSTGG